MRTTHFSIVKDPDQVIPVKEAARLLGRSPTWVRDRIGAGMLARHVDDAGKAAVSMHDVAALQRARAGQEAPPSRHLRLVVDNT